METGVLIKIAHSRPSDLNNFNECVSERFVHLRDLMSIKGIEPFDGYVVEVHGLEYLKIPRYWVYKNEAEFWADVKKQIGPIRYYLMWLFSLMPVKHEIYLRDGR